MARSAGTIIGVSRPKAGAARTRHPDLEHPLRAELRHHPHAVRNLVSTSTSFSLVAGAAEVALTCGNVGGLERRQVADLWCRGCRSPGTWPGNSAPEGSIPEADRRLQAIPWQS